jgi:hypothetical protein
LRPCGPNEVFYSPDGTRAVWIQGIERDAYLYDRTSSSRESRWLDWDVVDVQFIMDGGWLARIETEREDGSWSAFDADGNALPFAGPSLSAAEAFSRRTPQDAKKPLEASPAYQTLMQPLLPWD